MAWFTSVPIIDVHRDNFESIWPSIVLALRNASFVALDAELSGLGPRKNLMLRSFDDRYQALAKICKSHSVLSLGLSCFKVIPSRYDDEDTSVKKQLRFLVQTFNITMLCCEDYVVEPVALRFLVEHSFDFNKQYSQGVSYYRGLDKPDDYDPITPRRLFTELLLSSAPIVLHNGLIDLAFLYQNLYSDLPAKASQFICDLCEMFKGGVLDTKYVADFEARMVASYLEYVFRKSQRTNARNFEEGKRHVAVEFPTYPEGAVFVENHNCALPDNVVDGPLSEIKGVCEQYSAHGHCVNGKKCVKSHDADDILDEEEFKDVVRRRKRNLKKKERRQKQKEKRRQQNGEPNSKVPRQEDGTEEMENGKDGEEDHDDDDDHCMNSSGDLENEHDAGLISQSAFVNDSMRTSQDALPCQQSVKKELDSEQIEKDCDSLKEMSNQGLQDTTCSDQNADTIKCDGDDQLENKDKNNVSHKGKLVNESGDDQLQNQDKNNVTESGDQSMTGTTGLKPQYAGCHRAGFDAFMTGFAMATFVSEYGRIPSKTDQDASSDVDVPFIVDYRLEDLANKLYLGGKDVPLQITKSHFAKPSVNHREKMKRIWKTKESK